MMVWRRRKTGKEQWNEHLNTGVLSQGQPARCMWYLAAGWAWCTIFPGFLELWVGPGYKLEAFNLITQGALLSDLCCGPTHVAVGAAFGYLPTLQVLFQSHEVWLFSSRWLYLSYTSSKTLVTAVEPGNQPPPMCCGPQDIAKVWVEYIDLGIPQLAMPRG